jgi:hypothetical protein
VTGKKQVYDIKYHPTSKKTNKQAFDSVRFPSQHHMPRPWVLSYLVAKIETSGATMQGWKKTVYTSVREWGSCLMVPSEQGHDNMSI